MVKTLEEAATQRGIRLRGDGLRVHFSPIPNWYGCCTEFDCPRCGQQIDWKWNGKIPGFTNPETIAESGVKPEMEQGGELLEWGHRYIKIRCAGCGTELFADNFG